MNVVKMVFFTAAALMLTSLSIQCMDGDVMQVDQLQKESLTTILVEQDGKKIVQEEHNGQVSLVYYKQGKESVYEEIGRMSLPQYYLFVVTSELFPKELKQYILQLLVTKSLAYNFESSQRIPYMIQDPHGLQTPLMPGIIASITFSGNSEKIITGCTDKTVRVWDAKTGILSQEIGGYPASVVSVGCNYDGTVIFSRCHDMDDHEEGSVWAYNAKMRQLTRGLQDSSEEVGLVVPSPDGTMVFIKLYDPIADTWAAVIFDSTMENRLMTMVLYVQRAVFSPDSKRLLMIGYEGQGEIWDTEKKSLITSLKNISRFIAIGAFSPNNAKILIGSYDKKILIGPHDSPSLRHNSLQLRDAQTGKRIRTLSPQYKSLVGAVGFTPDGKTMLTIVPFNKAAFLFSTETGTFLGSIEAQGGYNPSVVFSPDSTLLLMGSIHETTYLRTTIFCDAYIWILNKVNCYQAWLIVKAAEAHREGKSLVLKRGSIEYKHLMDLPETIQNYLIKWYSLSADIQDCLKQWYSLSASDLPSRDRILNKLNSYHTWLIVKAAEAHKEGKPLVIDKGSFSFEWDLWRGLPEEIQDYLMHQYSVTASDPHREANTYS